jgi:hypothetical protein
VAGERACGHGRRVRPNEERHTISSLYRKGVVKETTDAYNICWKKIAQIYISQFPSIYALKYVKI